jgi:SpoVK/Ycf46/Vps4 family AAA+-type ATPase
MKSMEDDKGKYIVMAAGYQKEMERFLKSNPGLPSRFTKKFHFEDYKPDELEKIFHLTAGGKGYKLSDNAAESLKQHCKYMYENRGENFGNGRDIRNLFEQILQNQSMRLSRLIAEQTEIDNSLYSIIEAEDFPALKKDEGSLEKALDQLNSLIGLSAVKKEVSQLINYLKAEKLRNKGELSAANMTLHYIFTGNPGTGKTTVGRIISNIFKEMGLLSKGHLVEKDRGGLVGQYVGETAQKTTTAINESMGGVLFIDEAYALVPAQGGNDFGKEAVDTLLKRMEDDRGRFIVIAAGYINDMNRFLESNPGLTSRFPRKIDFEDYKPDELYAIFASMVKSRKMSMADNFSEKLKQRLNDIYNNRDKNFANGRTVRNLFESTLQQQSSRIAGIMNIEQDDPALNTFEAEDLI